MGRSHVVKLTGSMSVIAWFQQLVSTVGNSEALEDNRRTFYASAQRR
jgi:hypothetical protein